MITLECKYGKHIEIFGRNQLKQVYSREIKDFSPYFYIENKSGECTAIDGKKVSKIVCQSQSDLMKKKLKFNHYEADLLHVNRYIIDRIKKIEKEPIRICYLDIETDAKDGFSEPFEADNAITIIGLHDSFTDKKTTLELKKYGNERVLLYSFVDYIKSIDPDILVAWYGNGFDFPYILTRMKKLGIDINLLSRNGGQSYVDRKFRKSCKIYGRILFDMLEAYKKHFAFGGRESWKLDYISKYELGDLGGKEEYEGDLSELCEKDYSKYIKYNERDVELLVMLNNHLKIIDFFDEIRRLAFCRFEDVFMNSKTADCLCLKHARENNIVLPSVEYRNKEDKYEGGYVMECNPRLYENIVLMDFKSLYPNIMVGFNTSYETLDENGPISIGRYRFKQETGIIPHIVKPLLDKREKIKEKLNGMDARTLEYKNLKLTERAFKIMANSFYGVSGFRNFRLYKREVASAIAYIARILIKEAIKWFNEKGYKIIYGDTDSIFIQFDKIEIDEIKKINKEINEYFIEWANQFEIKEKNLFNLKFEEVFSVLFFKQKNNKEGAKKKYAGKIIWKNGAQTKEIAIVGFESRRSDYPEIGRVFLKRVLEMILDKDLPEKVKKYVSDFKEKIRNGEFKAEELGLPVSVNKPLEQYGNTIHIRASRLANKRHNEGIKNGDKIKYVYIKDDEDNVIAFKKKMFKGYKIDYEEMIRRIVHLKIEPIFRSLNWEYETEPKDTQKSLLS